MFSRSRKKIVASIMAALILFLAAVLGVIYLSSWLSVKRQNTEMLSRYVAMYSLESPPEKPPKDKPDPIPADAALYRLSSFYSAAISQDGDALAVDEGRSGIYTRGEIVELARSILQTGRASGRSGNLIYMTDERESYTLAAFMDVTQTRDSMNKVLINTLIAGSVSAGLFFLAAVYLARIIIDPLEENDSRQKRFISDAGHELKTPISIVSANAELLSRQVGDSEWLSNIRYENERMGRLVSEMLELSRAERTDAQTERVDFSRLTEREILPFEGVAFEKGMTIKSDISKGITVNGNSGQLCQLVSILMDNAVSHSTGGDISVRLAAEQRCAVLSVSNNAPEITENVRERLFDRFYRMDEARTSDGGHCGLGLAIAKTIVQAHRGRITADWSEGVVTFTVTLPPEK